MGLNSRVFITFKCIEEPLSHKRCGEYREWTAKIDGIYFMKNRIPPRAHTRGRKNNVLFFKKKQKINTYFFGFIHI